MRRLINAGILVVATVLTLGVMSSPVHASSSATSPDGGAAGAFTSLGEVFSLDDIKCDSHSVYIEYEIADGDNKRFSNTKGCNTPASKLDLSIAEGRSVDWKVCTNIQFGSDRCSPWIDDTSSQ